MGVVGTLDHPRNGPDLVDRLWDLPFVEVRTTEGRLQQDLPAIYQSLDYVLIPAIVEGGPMSLLEGLAIGKPVIAPDGVGMVPEFEDSPYIRRYPAGDVEALAHLVSACYEEKRQPSRLIEGRTWRRWADDHDRLFSRLLRERVSRGRRTRPLR